MKSALTLIKKAFSKRKKENPKFSIRMLARKVGVSNGFLSKVLSGKKTLSSDLATKLGHNLQMDELQKDQLKAALDLFRLPQKAIEISALEEYELAPASTEWILSKWYITAVLDLVTCEDFKESADWIASRLEISSTQANDALIILEKVGLIIRDENSGSLRKKYAKIRFPTKISKTVVRDFHLAQMRRAAQLMNLRNSQDDFDGRLITGLTVASNPEKIQEAKAILHTALYEVANLLSNGRCSEIYQINLQFFPHTKKKKN
jgi:uncharacterized protein (TIGR02147 family)